MWSVKAALAPCLPFIYYKLYTVDKLCKSYFGRTVKILCTCNIVELFKRGKAFQISAHKNDHEKQYKTLFKLSITELQLSLLPVQYQVFQYGTLYTQRKYMQTNNKHQNDDNKHQKTMI